MSRKLLLFTFLLFSLPGLTQEFNSVEAKRNTGFEQVEISSPNQVFVDYTAIRPSLSMPVPQLPEMQFSITEVDFSKKIEKRQVNLVAMMERKRYEKEEALVELESPVPTISKGEKALIEISNEIRMHDRSSNFDIYTGQKKIPAYEEMQTPLFRRGFIPRAGRGFISPGIYRSPYLR